MAQKKRYRVKTPLLVRRKTIDAGTEFEAGQYEGFERHWLHFGQIEEIKPEKKKEEPEKKEPEKKEDPPK